MGADPLLFPRRSRVSKRAVMRLDARRHSGGQTLVDQSGRGHDAQLGSTGGSDTNDPLFLEHTGTNFVYLPGTAGNYVSLADSAALSPTGDQDWRIRVAMTDWTDATEPYLLTKDDTTNRTMRIEMLGDGRIRFRWWEADNTERSVTSSAAVGATDGDYEWLRVRLDVDDGAGGHDVEFALGGSGVTPSWAELGTSQNAGAFTTSVKDSSAILAIGAHFDGGKAVAGRVPRAVAYSDLTETTKILDWEPNKSFTVDQANSAVVTINRSATGAKSVEVTRNVFLLHTDDYFNITDHADLNFAETEAFTVVWVGRVYGTTADHVLIAKKDDLTTAAGYLIDRGTNNAVEFTIADGALDDVDVASALTEGEFTVVAGVRNVTDDDIEIFTNGVGSGSPTTDSTAATLANAFPLRIGRFSDAGTGYGDSEFLAALLFREALTDADIKRLQHEMGLLL